MKEKDKGNKSVLNTTVPLSMSFNSKLLACRRNIPSIFTTPALFVLQKIFVYIIIVTWVGKLEKHRGVLCSFHSRLVICAPVPRTSYITARNRFFFDITSIIFSKHVPNKSLRVLTIATSYAKFNLSCDGTLSRKSIHIFSFKYFSPISTKIKLARQPHNVNKSA